MRERSVYEVVSNRPKVNAFRAPHVPQCTFAAESVIDELATKLGIDPIEFRLKNVMRDGCTTIYGEKFGPIGVEAVLEAVKASDHYRSPVPAGAGRGVASGFWFNRGGETTASLTIAPDGSVNDPARPGRRRRLAHGDQHDGGGGARHSGRQGPRDHRRHQRARAQHASPPAAGRCSRAAWSMIDSARKAIAEIVPARRQELERARGGRGVRRRLVPAGEFECRRICAAVDRRSRQAGRHHRTFRTGRHRPGSGLWRPGRRRRRSTRRPAASRCCAIRCSPTPARRFIHCSFRASSRARSSRAPAGRSTRNTSTAPMVGCRIRASSTTAFRSPPTPS